MDKLNLKDMAEKVRKFTPKQINIDVIYKSVGGYV
jgi:hypothetical protein